MAFDDSKTYTGGIAADDAGTVNFFNSFRFQYGTFGNRPAAGNRGVVYYETDTGNTAYDTGSAWVYRDYRVRKSADEAVNNSDVLQNDDHLKLALGANEVWLVEIMLLITDPGDVPDIKFGWAYPVGCTMYWGQIAKDTAGAAGIGWMQTSTSANPPALSTQITVLSTGIAGGVISGAIYRAIVINGANAGNLNLQWAQVTAQVQDTKVLTNSCLIAHKLA